MSTLSLIGANLAYRATTFSTARFSYSSVTRTAMVCSPGAASSVIGANIEVVLVDTEAHKAIDVFYLTCRREEAGAGNE